MHRSTDRFLTTHTGSLHRPWAAESTLLDSEAGDEEVREVLAHATNQAVRHQLDLGLDVITDGEQARRSYVGHLLQGWSGFGGESPPIVVGDLVDFPGAATALATDRGYRQFAARPACIAPIITPATPAITTDVDRFATALQHAVPGPAGAIVTAPSPGAVAMFFDNQYYASWEDYLAALVEALRPEYQAVLDAGMTLQIDAPDLGCAHVLCPQASHEQAALYREMHIEAINAALQGQDPQKVRMHVCWGNYQGPHHRDIELIEIADQILRAAPAGLLVEAANPRHAHEWRVWEEVRLPDEKVLVPGVIDTVTTTIEHPELVAERLERYAQLVGRERVVGGTDCGFGTLAGMQFVDAEVAAAKLDVLVEGAERATKRCF